MLILFDNSIIRILPMNLPYNRNPMVRRSGFKHLNRLQGCLIIAFVGTLLMLCSCVGTIALYVVIPQEPVNILIMGLDSRGSEGVVTRTDSVMIVGIQPSRMNL